jgi:hypothetical protein
MNAPAITPETFRAQLAALTAQLAGRALRCGPGRLADAACRPGQCHLRGPEGRSCQAGVEAGWLCTREAGGIRFNRIFKPAADLQGFSVDVVDMRDVAGPHHVHPLGEIDLAMPLGRGRHLRRPRGRLARVPAGQRPPPHRGAGPRPGAVPAARGRIDFTAPT